jgi:hypothetical protein
MKKIIFAATVAAAMMYAPLAQAATVFNINFHGTFAVFGNASAVDGTGTITTTGGTGLGFENATPGSSSPKLTDVQIDLGLGHFDLGDALVASFGTFNNNPVSFIYQGAYTTPSGGFFPNFTTFNTLVGNTFMVIDTVTKNTYFGEFDITAVSSAVPEPATWAMLLLGFGGIGVMLRNRRKALSAAV